MSLHRASRFPCNLLAVIVSILLVPLAAFAQPARQNTAFHAVPGAKLAVRAVQYDGSVNGTLKVEVKNSDKVAHQFTATGLYFVPQGDPDSAPQRLGAVGPLHLGDDAKERTAVDVPAGQTIEVAVDVFCIDSHRDAPTSANKFDVGATRMPVELSRAIEQRADQAVSEMKTANPSAPPAATRAMAKGAIQSGVWDSRNRKWTKLDGEGKQETGK
ncbi:MAG TPA: hypothetical protein VH143_12670 [Kofleriaceae bacterium]|jgi:hypothetical protein|nr:hypothetical protein [Kofleriaceae bacterium]